MIGSREYKYSHQQHVPRKTNAGSVFFHNGTVLFCFLYCIGGIPNFLENSR